MIRLFRRAIVVAVKAIDRAFLDAWGVELIGSRR